MIAVGVTGEKIAPPRVKLSVVLVSDCLACIEMLDVLWNGRLATVRARDGCMRAQHDVHGGMSPFLVRMDIRVNVVVKLQ